MISSLLSRLINNWLIAFANFHGENILTVINFKWLIRLTHKIPENMTIDSWEPIRTGSNLCWQWFSTSAAHCKNLRNFIYTGYLKRFWHIGLASGLHIRVFFKAPLVILRCTWYWEISPYIYPAFCRWSISSGYFHCMEYIPMTMFSLMISFPLIRLWYKD